MSANRDPLFWAAWIAALTAVAFASHSYTPIDETRYLSVAWEMWQRGDFLVPFKNGEPYSHKPPLLFWLMHAGWALTGVNDWWPRLISPLLAFASLFLVRAIAAGLWPDRSSPARMAPWILMGSLLWALHSHTIMFDLLLACCVLLGILGLVRAAQAKPHAWKLFALAVGLGALAKGPAILLHLLPAALLAPWWAGNAPLPWRRWYGHLGLAVLGGASLALLWAIPAGLLGGEAYRHAIFWGQTANRMVESFAHQRPFWWYLPLLPFLLFPWLLWPALWRGARVSWSTGDAGARLLLAWTVPAFLAFSLISGKQVHYLLPEFPAFALLASRWLEAGHAPSRPWLQSLLLALLGTALLLLPYLKPTAGAGLHGVSPWGGALFLALALLFWFHKAEPAPQVPRLSMLAMLVLAALHLVLIRPMATAYDVRPMARAIAHAQADARQVAHYGRYHAQYQFAGRLLQPLPELDKQSLRAWVQAHPNGWVVMYFPKGRDLSAFKPRFAHPYRGDQAALLESVHALAAMESLETSGRVPKAEAESD